VLLYKSLGVGSMRAWRGELASDDTHKIVEIGVL